MGAPNVILSEFFYFVTQENELELEFEVKHEFTA